MSEEENIKYIILNLDVDDDKKDVISNGIDDLMKLLKKQNSRKARKLKKFLMGLSYGN